MPLSELSDASLLRDYATQRNEDAFAELMRRHLPVVYSAAARRLEDDRSAAEDVTQSVFLQLAQSSHDLIHHPVLAGWLYVTAARKAADRSRTRVRRSRRERMHPVSAASEAPEPDWSEIKPLLDEALLELAEDDRHAVLLRYFDGREFAAVGRDLGVSPDAARMRVARGLERLRALLRKRGITSSAMALEALLVQEALGAVPSGLASSIARAVRTVPAPEAAASLTTALAKFVTAMAVLLLASAVGTTAVRSWRARHPALPPGVATSESGPKGIAPGDAIRFLRGRAGKRPQGAPVDPRVEQALGYLRSALFDSNLGTPERLRLLQESAGMLVGLEGETIPLFREALTSSDPEVVRLAVEGIGHFGALPREFAPELLALLENPQFKEDAGLIANRLLPALLIADSPVPPLLALLERRPDLSDSIQYLLVRVIASSGPQLASNRQLMESLLTDPKPEIQALAKEVLAESPEPPIEPTAEASSRLTAGLRSADAAERRKAFLETMRLPLVTSEMRQALAELVRQDPSVQLRVDARIVLDRHDPGDPALAAPPVAERERATRNLLARVDRQEASVSELVSAVVDRSTEVEPVLYRLAKLGASYWEAHGEDKVLVVGVLASLHNERDPRLYEAITEAYAQVNHVPRTTYPLDQLAPFFASMESALTQGEFAIAMRDLRSSLDMYWRSHAFTQREPTHLPDNLVRNLLVGPYHQNRPAYEEMLRAIRTIDPAFQPPPP